jgi:hypothetical protein
MPRQSDLRFTFTPAASQAAFDVVLLGQRDWQRIASELPDGAI